MMAPAKKKRRKLSAKEKKALWQTEINAGIGWDFPRWKRTHANRAYTPTDPIDFERGNK